MNIDIYAACLLMMLLTNLIFICIIIFVLIKLNTSIENKVELENVKFNLSFEPKDSDFQLLDNLIQEKISEYRVLKLENMDKLYINEKIQEQIFEYVLRKVMYQLSPIYIQKLSYIYNTDRLDDIITQKINLHILEYTIEINGNIRT